MLLLCLLGRPSKPVHSRLCLEIVAHFFLKTVLFFGCFCRFTLGFGGLFKKAMGFVVLFLICPCVSFQAWRLRFWSTEKCIAPAKPLYFLPCDLELAKGACERLI